MEIRLDGLIELLSFYRSQFFAHTYIAYTLTSVTRNDT